MKQEIVEKVKKILSENFIDRGEFIRIIYSLTNEEKMILIDNLDINQKIKYIETAFLLDYRKFHRLMLQIKKEFVFLKDDINSYFNWKTATHNFLTDNDIDEMLEKVNESRNILLRKEEYGSLLCETLYQHVNLKHNSIPILGSVKSMELNLDFMSLYLDFLSIYQEKFSRRDINDLKSSIINSIYVSRESKLFERFVLELKNNKKDSFLMIPITQKLLDDGFHDSVCIVKKVDNKLVLTYFDKAMHYDYKILPCLPQIEKNNNQQLLNISHKNNNYKIAMPLVMEINDTTENIILLTHLFDFGTSYVGKELQECLKDEKNEFLVIQKELVKLSDKIYWLPEIYDVQMYANNCHVKSVSAALQHILGSSYVTEQFVSSQNKITVKKIPGLTAADITISLAEIMKYRLMKMGYTSELSNYIDKITNIYLSGKNTLRTRIQKKENLKELTDKLGRDCVPIFDRQYDKNMNYTFNDDISKNRKNEPMIDIQLLNLEEIRLIKENIDRLTFGNSLLTNMNRVKKKLADSLEMKEYKQLSRDDIDYI